MDRNLQRGDPPSRPVTGTLSVRSMSNPGQNRAQRRDPGGTPPDERIAYPVPMAGPIGRRRLLLLAGALVLAATVMAMLLWPSQKPPDPPRARQYLEFTACLLTDERGLAGPEAAAVWAGMQDASLATRAKVQYLSITGPQTVDNASTFVASLAQGGCGLVLAAGELPIAAIGPGAERFPQTRFAVVNGERPVVRGQTPAPNVTVVAGPSPTEVRAAVNQTVVASVTAPR